MHALGIATNHRHREDPGAFADLGPAGYHSVRMDFDAVLQHHFRTNPREGADDNVFANDGAVLNHGKRVDARAGGNHAHSPSLRRIIAPISASAARVPSTRASQWNFQILPRCFCLRTWNSTRSPGTTG